MINLLNDFILFDESKIKMKTYLYIIFLNVSKKGSVETTKSKNVSLSGFGLLYHFVVSVIYSTQWFWLFIVLSGFSFLQYLVVSVFLLYLLMVLVNCMTKRFCFFIQVSGFIHIMVIFCITQWFQLYHLVVLNRNFILLSGFSQLYW